MIYHSCILYAVQGHGCHNMMSLKSVLKHVWPMLWIGAYIGGYNALVYTYFRIEQFLFSCVMDVSWGKRKSLLNCQSFGHIYYQVSSHPDCMFYPDRTHERFSASDAGPLFMYAMTTAVVLFWYCCIDSHPSFPLTCSLPDCFPNDN